MSANASDGRPAKRWVVICIVAAVVVSCAGWLRLKLDSSLEPLLPENSEARETILFSADSSFADKAVLWFRLRGDGPVSDLFAAADATEKRLDPGLIKSVIHPPEEANMLDEAFALSGQRGGIAQRGGFERSGKGYRARGPAQAFARMLSATG